MSFNEKRIKKAIIIIVVFLFMLYMAATDITFRPDEEFTMALIKHNFLSVVKLDSFDVHPPLYYLLLKLFLDIITFWTSSIFIKIIFARLFSSLIVLASFIIISKLINNLGIHENGYIALILFIGFPSIIFFATQIRMYALAGLFLSLEFYELDKFDKFGKKRNLLLLILFTILTAYTHYFAAVSAGILLLVFFIKYLFNKNNYKSICVFMSGLLLALSYIPWMLYSVTKLRGNSNVDNYRIPFTLKTILKQLLGIPVKFTGISDSSLGSFKGIIVYPVILIIFILMVILIIFSLKNLNEKFNERLTEELITFVLTAFVCSIIKMLGFEYSAMFLYPIFIINVVLTINILLCLVKKNNLINIINIISIFILICSVGYSIYYGYLNKCQSFNTVKAVKLLNKKPVIKFTNTTLHDKLSFPRLQQLLENKAIFHTMNISTYLLYYNKKVIIRKGNRYKVFLMTNSKKIGNNIWTNIIIKK